MIPLMFSKKFRYLLATEQNLNDNNSKSHSMGKIQKITVFSILIGIAVTLVSGVLINPFIVGDFPKIRVVSKPVLGVVYWGYLLPWLKRVVIMPIPPKTIIWQNLIIDLVVWSIIPFAVLTVFLRRK